MSCVSSTDGIPAGFQDWANVLAHGAISGGTNPTISAGDSIQGLGNIPIVTGGFTTTYATASGAWTYPGSATYESASPSVTVGNHTGSPAVVIEKADAGQATVQFDNSDDDRWQLQMASNENFLFQRYVAGAFQENTSIAHATHNWDYPGAGWYNSGSPDITVGNGTGAPIIRLNQSGDEVGEMQIWNGGGNLLGILFGAGAPASAPGNDRFYFRSDGAAGTSIYKRTGGAWVAIA